MRSLGQQTRSFPELETGGPILSRRFRSGPPALGHFAEAETSPAETPSWRLKELRGETDMPDMDANGARSLAARIRAGVSIGMRIELVDDPHDESGLCAGDRGVVERIDDSGVVLVSWDRGFARGIDPELTTFRPLAA